MKQLLRCILVVILHVVVTSSIVAQVSTSLPAVDGTFPDKTLLYSSGFIESLQQELLSFRTEHNYAIQIQINGEILDPRKSSKMDPTDWQKILIDRRNECGKAYKNLSKVYPYLNNGILYNIDLLFKSTYVEDPGLSTFFTQTTVLGSGLNSFARTSLNSLPALPKPKTGASNIAENEAQLRAVVDNIKAIFIEAKNYPKDYFVFGPLRVKVEQPTIVNQRVDGINYKKYTSVKTSFDIALTSVGIESITLRVTDATINFLYDEATGNYRDVVISKSNSEKVFVGHLVFLNVYYKGLNLTIQPQTGLNGSIQLNTFTDRDIELQNLLVFKHGFNADFTYVFSNAQQLSGSYDFSAIRNFQLELVKNHKIIASTTASLTADGAVTGDLVVTTTKEIPCSFTNLLVKQLNVKYTISLKDGVKIHTGSGLFEFSDIQGTEGAVLLGVSIDANGNIDASLNTQNMNLSICKAQIKNPSLQVSLDNNWDLLSIEGSGELKHPDIDNNVSLDLFLWSAQKGIEIFKARGIVTYKGFKFELSEVNYSSRKLIISAKVELNTTGTTDYLQVTDFTIKEDGSVSIGGISGNINKGSIFALQFNAEFSEDRFKGYFNGRFVDLISVEGAVDIGQVVTASNSRFTFCYLKLVVGSGTLGVPLSPLPIKLTKLGGEFGYNYYLDFAHGGEGNPRFGTYIVGLTVGISDLAGITELTGNPVVMISNSSLEFAMNGNLKVPRVDPWFNLGVTAGCKLPQGEIYGGYTADFKIPKTSGVLVNTTNLGMNFLITPNNWYAGRRNINVRLFNAINLESDFEFTGSFTNTSIYYAYMAGQLRLDYNWSGSKTVSILDYDIVRASARFELSCEADASLTIKPEGIAGRLSVNLDAQGEINLSICPSCNWDWTRVDVAVNARLAGGMEFQNTTVHLWGDGNFSATILGRQGSFEFDVDYTFDPTRDGSGTYTATANTDLKPVPVSATSFALSSNMPTAGQASAYNTAYQRKVTESRNNAPLPNANPNYITTLVDYPNITRQINANAALIAGIDGKSTLESRLKSSGSYVLTSINSESANDEGKVLLAYARYLKSNPGQERNFATNRAQYDTWLTKTKQSLLLVDESTNLNDYPSLKEKLESIRTTTLPQIEGAGVFEIKLKNSGSYVLHKLNEENVSFLVDYANFLKTNRDFETKFKDNFYLFDDWLEAARRGTGATVTLSDDDFDDVAASVANLELIRQYSSRVVTPAGVLDIIVHGSGSNFIIDIGGRQVETSHRDFSRYLNQQMLANKTLRLLSCNNLQAAQNLSNKIGQPIIATDGYVRIYSDGGIKSVARIGGNGDTKWYLLKPNQPRTEANAPRAPGASVVEFVQMGGGDNGLPDEVQNATQNQLESLYESIVDNLSKTYTAGSIEHKSIRWMQYKASGGSYSYSSWSNVYNSNINKAKKASAVEESYMNNIGWGDLQVSQPVVVDDKNLTRRLDIADVSSMPKRAIEVKAYESGKVYYTKDIQVELKGDIYLITKYKWSIQWVFIGCSPSTPLRDALTNAGIEIIEIPKNYDE